MVFALLFYHSIFRHWVSLVSPKRTSLAKLNLPHLILTSDLTTSELRRGRVWGLETGDCKNCGDLDTCIYKTHMPSCAQTHYFSKCVLYSSKVDISTISTVHKELKYSAWKDCINGWVLWLSSHCETKWSKTWIWMSLHKRYFFFFSFQHLLIYRESGTPQRMHGTCRFPVLWTRHVSDVWPIPVTSVKFKSKSESQ